MYFIQQDQPIVRYAQINLHQSVLRGYFSGADTKPALRLKRPSVALFISMLQEKDHGWSREIEALVTLYWLAAGLSYRVTGDNFDIPTSTVHRICHRVVEEMMTSILHRVIHFPTVEEMEEVGATFAWLAGHRVFRHAVGAIDGCHVRIVPPKMPQKKCYVNRKLFPSVVLQAICDGNGKFLDIYVGR